MAGDPRIAPVSRIAPAVQAEAAATPARAETAPQVASMVKEMAAKPPVDAERVAQIKRAIADGTFPLNPAKVADQLIALRYEWMSDDQA